MTAELRSSYIHEVCGRTTTMGRVMAETFAQAAHATAYCAYCKRRYPVSEFRWTPGGERVG
jgi:hypothetical protein